MMRTASILVAELLFAAYVVHAASQGSTQCPMIGACASIHLQQIRSRPILAREARGLVLAARAGH